MTEPMIISWAFDPDSYPGIIYSVNSEAVGRDDSGFEKIIEIINSEDPAKLIIRLKPVNALGGESMEGTLPFANRYQEFEKAVAGKNLTYEFS